MTFNGLPLACLQHGKHTCKETKQVHKECCLYPRARLAYVREFRGCFDNLDQALSFVFEIRCQILNNIVHCNHVQSRICFYYKYCLCQFY